MREPLPDGKVLGDELRAWAGALGAKSWVPQRYSPTAAVLARNRRVRVADPVLVGGFGDMCRETIAPLGYYSAGWCTSLAPLAPSGLRKPIGTAVREARRVAARRVRGAMVEASPPVHESFDTVDAFVQNPTVRAYEDEKVALDAFVTAVARLLDTGVAGATVLTPADTTLLAELGERVVNDFGATPAEPLTAARRVELREIAVEFARRVVDEQFTGKELAEEHMSEAFERVVTTYVNRLHRGKTLEGTEFYLRLRLDAVRIDEWRRNSARHRHEGRLILDGDPDGGRADDRIEADPTPSTTGSGDLVAEAAKIISEDKSHRIDGRLYWEARTAIRLLTTDLDVGTQGDLRRVISDLWCSEQPVDARSGSSGAAEMDVLLTLQTASRRARHALTEAAQAGEAS